MNRSKSTNISRLRSEDNYKKRKNATRMKNSRAQKRQVKGPYESTKFKDAIHDDMIDAAQSLITACNKKSKKAVRNVINEITQNLGFTWNNIVYKPTRRLDVSKNKVSEERYVMTYNNKEWVYVKNLSIENAGLGLFAAKSFRKGNIF